MSWLCVTGFLVAVKENFVVVAFSSIRDFRPVAGAESTRGWNMYGLLPHQQGPPSSSDDIYRKEKKKMGLYYIALGRNPRWSETVRKKT